LPRKALVVLLIVAALGLIVWSGITNYRARQTQQKLRAQQQIVLTPDTSSAAGSDSMQMPPSPLEGKTAPNFKLEDTSGKKVSLSDYKGKAVLVNFWATWCGPCKVEIPWFEKLRDQYAGQGFEILGISSDQLDTDDKGRLASEKADVAKFASGMHMNYPVLLGGEDISKDWGGVDSLPESFYIDKTGKIVTVVTGLGTRDEVEANIRKVLGVTTPSGAHAGE
jgi:peroxiredoxin